MSSLPTATLPQGPASAAPTAPAAAPGTAFRVLSFISASHMVNDMMQSLIVAMYPVLKGNFELNFAQIGLITFTFQLCASLFQPLVGLYTDKRPVPWSLPAGMCFTLVGLVLLAFAWNFPAVLVASGLIGVGSSIFHPEASRIARMASGGRHGLAQSLFQVGGNSGSALGPLLAALVIVPFGQRSVAWFGLGVLLGIVLLLQVSRWYAHQTRVVRAAVLPAVPPLPPGRTATVVGMLLLLIFSKYFYVAGISSFFTFYLIGKFGISVQSAQLHLFVFLAASATGTLVGGPLGDRIGRRPIIWFSILGIAPFALALPYVGLFWTTVFSIAIGLILSSAFSAILVYAQELMPGKIGMVSGLFFGFAFGMGGLGAAVLGVLADHTSIDYVYRLCAWLPLLGIVAALLPDIEKKKRRSAA